MEKISILDIVNADICIGCGMCIAQEESLNHKMVRNKFGFLVPNVTRENNLYGKSVSVCPFNPFPESDVRTEKELAALFLKSASNYDKHVGRFISTYVGYSPNFRMSSSSGGLATYILYYLLSNKIVDGAIVVVPSDSDRHYNYQLITNSEELLHSSKTKYYPVTLSEAMTKLKDFQGNVAISGVGCFIKAVRLFQHYNPEISEKVKFTIGIICGGVKSDFFAEYLAASAGADPNAFKSPLFRIKDPSSLSSDYSFGCTDLKGKWFKIKMRLLGDMWGSGLFKNNACDFCDDVTTELADISLGDAWFGSYRMDGSGTNVIVTRSLSADEIIQKSINGGELNVQELSFDQFYRSQRASFRHRQEALGYRIHKRVQKNLFTPPKRFNEKKISHLNKAIQNARQQTRKKSLTIWANSPNADVFNKQMKFSRDYLKYLTYFNHALRKLKR